MAENMDDKKEEVKSEEKTGLSVLKKFMIGVSVVLLAILVAAYWIGSNEEYVTKKIEDWRAEKYEKAIQKHNDEMKARYTADTDGGKTPEETIDMFIVAIKAGDIEKASKYYVLEKQGEELGHLKEMLSKYGNLQKSIDFYSETKEKGIKMCNEKGDGCTFEYEYIRTEASTTTAFISGQNLVFVSPAGSKGRKIIDVGLNHRSGVWKIELP